MPRFAFIFLVFCLLLAGSLHPSSHTAASFSLVATNSSPQHTITVNNTADVVANDGRCTLREAVTSANKEQPSGTLSGECPAGNGEDIIFIPAGHYVLTLVGNNEEENLTGDLDIRDHVQLVGEGANRTIIDGNGTDRVINSHSIHLGIEDLAIVNGYSIAANGGGISHFGSGGHSLTLRRVSVRGNRAVQGGHGGGIYMDTALFILEQSEVSDNSAHVNSALQGGKGGGIYAGGTPVGSTFRLSTISGNHADASGGGVLITGRMYFTQVTVTDNEVATGLIGFGGGIVSEIPQGQPIKGSLIANNRAGGAPDCLGNFHSHWGNLIGDPSGCNYSIAQDDQVNVNPLLDELRDNGGFGTRTHALLEGSPAIDHGKCDSEQSDQRGYPRPIDHPTIPGGESPCDNGAYERTTLAGTPTVTLTATPIPSPTIPTTPTNTPRTAPPTGTITPTRTSTPTPTPIPLPPETIMVNSDVDVLADDGQCTLREAITAANNNAPSGNSIGECSAGRADMLDTIFVPAGTYQLTKLGPDEDYNDRGDLDIRGGVQLYGAGQELTILDGYLKDRVLDIHGQHVVIAAMTITGGRIQSQPNVVPESGGGIYANEAYLTLVSVRIHDNRAGSFIGIGGRGGHGGGIAQFGGTLGIYKSEISENYAGNGGNGVYEPPIPGGEGGSGGGIYINGHVTIEESKFEGNHHGQGGWYGTDGLGGSIRADEIHLSKSMIRNNEGALYGFGSTIIESTIHGNTEGIRGYNAKITNSTISSNEIFGVDLANVLEGIHVTILDNGIGVRTGGFSTLTNSLIDRNETQCIGNVYSGGHNLFGFDFGCQIFGNTEGNYVGVDSRMAPLADNDGPTYTHSPNWDSPALDAGNCEDFTTDQRGFPRPSDLPSVPNAADGCDIGAYEEQAPPLPTPTITPTATVTFIPTVTPDGKEQTLFLPLIQR